MLWSETALCGDVPRGGETCREFGVGTSVTLRLKIADVGENNLGRVGRGHGELGIFLGTDGHGFLKRHGWLRDWSRLYLHKGYTKV